MLQILTVGKRRLIGDTKLSYSKDKYGNMYINADSIRQKIKVDRAYATEFNNNTLICDYENNRGVYTTPVGSKIIVNNRTFAPVLVKSKYENEKDTEQNILYLVVDKDIGAKEYVVDSNATIFKTFSNRRYVGCAISMSESDASAHQTEDGQPTPIVTIRYVYTNRIENSYNEAYVYYDPSRKKFYVGKFVLVKGELETDNKYFSFNLTTTPYKIMTAGCLVEDDEKYLDPVLNMTKNVKNSKIVRVDTNKLLLANNVKDAVVKLINDEFCYPAEKGPSMRAITICGDNLVGMFTDNIIKDCGANVIFTYDVTTGESRCIKTP